MQSTLLSPAVEARRERNPWAVFALLAVTQFMVVLDTGIVYVALPSIQRDLGMSQVGLAWVMDAYILTFGGFMLLGGMAADRLGRRQVLYGAMVFFGLASLACGLATAPWEIIAARAAQGLGAAVVAPAALALVTDTFKDGPDRYKALGIFGGIGGVAGAAGTIIGGALTAISWQWAFLVNVPLVIVLLVIGTRMLPEGTRYPNGRMDLIGALTSTSSLCLLLYVVLHVGSQGWNTATVGAAVAGVVLLAGFVARQLTAQSPLIPRALFRLRNVVLGNVANAAAGALLFGVFFTVTLYLQLVRGYSPVQAALGIVPISVFFFLGSQLAFRLFAKVGGPVNALAGGLVIQAVGLAWWALALSPTGNVLTASVLPGIVWGLGGGVVIVSAFVVCTSGLHGPVMGAASGLVSTTLQVGGALGVAVLSVVAARQAAGATPGEALTAGHSAALWVAMGLALLAVPVMLWLRATWRPAPHGHGHDDHAPAAPAGDAAAPQSSHQGKESAPVSYVLDDQAQDLLFRQARTANTFTDEPVTDAQVAAIYDLVKWAPTSFNQQPLRVAVVRSAGAKDTLVDNMWDANQDKTRNAPLSVVLAIDLDFHENLPSQFPFFPQAKDVFFSDPAVREESAVLNGSLQVAYFILGVRAIGLAAGPMTGFNVDPITKEFFGEGNHRAIAVINVGKPGEGAWYDRLPRLEYSEIVRTV
ncbi:malonic semialdehyde reductase [Longispora sp. NPDC051575]|uniref:malonic semialdehyde reductase n=1 Tax=Longispora sp. NPDC051575 TaxID=3154943 RepID=UPI003420EBD0